MGKNKDKNAAVAQPTEFQIVVKHPTGKGPLAPHRFILTFVIAVAVAGRPLWAALQIDEGVDMALLRLSGAAVFAWFVLGKIDKILADASVPPPSVVHDDRRSEPDIAA